MTLSQLIMSNNGGKVTLDKDYEESIKILSSYSVTLDLAGHRLSNSDDEYTITNMGSLTLMDSVGGGVIYNSASKKGCLVNLNRGNVTIKDGVAFEMNNPRPNKDAWYYIANMGALMVIEDAVVEGTAPNASTIRNGFYTESNDDGHTCAMVINGGRFGGELIPVKNDSYGILTINGGSFISPNECVLAWNKCSITGGTFKTTNNFVVFSGAYTDRGCDGGLSITGGTFEGTKGIIKDLTESYAPEKVHSAKIGVSGGSFNMEVPKDYLPSGIEMSLVDGKYVFNKVGWDVTEFSPGGGFANMKRCVLHASKLNYVAGGFPIPAIGFTPIAIMGCNAVGGVTAYYDPESRKVLLYTNGSEASGSIKDLTVVLIGY